MVLDKNERMEDLEYKGLKIIQNNALYCFTSDAVILANFVKTKAKDNVVEIGAGSGVISILVNAKNKLNFINAIEIQKEMAVLCEKNILLNNNSDKILVHNVSIQDYVKQTEVGSVDVVVSNPPYKKQGASFHNDNQIKAVARHEIMLDLKELCFSASSLLKFGGKFYIVYDANRSAELIYELIKCKMEPKKMFYTQSRLDKKPTLVIIEAVKGGKPGVSVLPVLITNDKNGDYLKEIQHTYKRG